MAIRAPACEFGAPEHQELTSRGGICRPGKRPDQAVRSMLTRDSICQVAYYMDCLARANQFPPAKWLALIDTDEFLLPHPFEKGAARALLSFLDTRGEATASVCLGRTHFRQPAIFSVNQSSADLLPSSEPPRLLYLGSQLEPHKRSTEWNLKCIHRADAVESVSVHWPETFRKNQRADQIEWHEKLEWGTPQLAHLRDSELLYRSFKDKNQASLELNLWVRQLWNRRDLVEKL